MNKTKTKAYMISGIFLAYFGLRDLEKFNIIYHGIAISMSVTAFVLAFMEYKKDS
jgi:hypothetical protein